MKKVVVAFSGGLDTSYTVMKLAKEGYEVHAACANTGGFSPEQLKTNEENAYKLGAKQYVTLDVTQEYYEKSLKYMIYGNVMRNNCYPISVSSERIFQAIAIARYAKQIGADAIAHGSTGAGNDQIRFDMTFLVMAPGVEIITLTRDKALSRKEEVDYLNENGFFADFTKLKYSYNVGIWGTSICGGEILDSTQGLPEEAYLKHVTREDESELKITFDKGEIVAVNGEKFDDKVAAIQKIEEIGAAYGIGRDCNVGDTIIGIKGRVGFEAAAPKLIIEAHRLLEKYTLSKWQQYWKDQVAIFRLPVCTSSDSAAHTLFAGMQIPARQIMQASGHPAPPGVLQNIRKIISGCAHMFPNGRFHRLQIPAAKCIQNSLVLCNRTRITLRCNHAEKSKPLYLPVKRFGDCKHPKVSAKLNDRLVKPGVLGKILVKLLLLNRSAQLLVNGTKQRLLPVCQPSAAQNAAGACNLQRLPDL